MKWYYAVDNQQMGPVDDQTFNSLITDHTITSDTLVWNQTMSDWTTFGEIEKDSGHAALNTDPALPTGTCSQCGKTLPDDELVSFNDAMICAACKPAVLQKIREGVATKALNFAGFWIRAAAKIIDAIIVGVVNFILSLAFGAFIAPMMSDPSAMSSPEKFNQIMIPSILLSLLQWGINIFYTTWFIGKYSATPGKMVLGLKIVTANNEKVSYLRAFGRFFAEILSAMILCIGYLMVAFDSEKKGLHDRICSTRVIKK